jgi:hypothetical protein
MNSHGLVPMMLFGIGAVNMKYCFTSPSRRLTIQVQFVGEVVRPHDEVEGRFELSKSLGFIDWI